MVLLAKRYNNAFEFVKVMYKLDTATCADFPNIVAQRHVLGVRTPGAMTPNSNSAEIFVQSAYPQVSSSCVYSFGSNRVDKHTNKQTPLKTSNVLRYATTFDK